MITKKSFTGITIGILAIFFITPMVFADESREMDHNEVLIRASDILGIKLTDLHDALKTAHKEVSAKNIKSRLQNLVEEGEISELDVEQITEWKNTQPEGIKSLKKVIETLRSDGNFVRLSKQDLAIKALEMGFVTEIQLNEINDWFNSRPEFLESIKPYKNKLYLKNKYKGFQSHNYRYNKSWKNPQFNGSDNFPQFDNTQRLQKDLTIPKTNS